MGWMLALSCAPAQQAAGGPHGDGRPPARTEECDAARRAILADIEASRARPCAADADCATVTNPGSAVHEYDLVAAAADRASLDRRSAAHLEACGAFIHHVPLDAYRAVSARCASGRCEARELLVHVE